jgi:hypothetical protein
MLFQRLIADNTEGLNYSYMGYAEFEYGVTGRSRRALALAMLEKDIKGKFILFKGRWGKNSSHFKAFVIGMTDDVDSVEPIFKPIIEKANLREEDPHTVGWLTVAPYVPLVIFREDANLQSNINRLEKYLQLYVSVFEEERKAGL